MRKQILIPIIILSSVITILFISWFMWYLKTDKTLNIYILDKTVPTPERTEHKSFSWILNYNKYVKPDGNLYDINEDYYGFFPSHSADDDFTFKSIRIHEISDFSKNYDMLYYTDTYGVYYNEWYKKNKKELKYNQKVYGGLNQNDYLLLKDMKQQGKLIITEFNLYNAPTNELIRQKVETIFGLNWSGWTGRYFESLDITENSEFPQWLVKLYKEQHNNQWPFTKSGIVLVHKFGTIAILEQGTHLINSIPRIVSQQETVDRFGVCSQINYSQWFDITYSSKQNTVLSNFKIDVSAKGDSILKSYNITPI
ncbi:MAG: hypothetical protein MI739_00800, partial [Bacteroidales bacterium]|nr:hypothetical protein [Bacteroidales bacterium]